MKKIFSNDAESFRGLVLELYTAVLNHKRIDLKIKNLGGVTIGRMLFYYDTAPQVDRSIIRSALALYFNPSQFGVDPDDV